MSNKLWIIGDSFSDFSDNDKWTKIISNNFNGEANISSNGSRDFQTILDIFLKNLKNISKNDFVILIIPSLVRVRLPLKNSTLAINGNGNSELGFDYFIGATSYVKDSPYCKLEHPLCDVDEFILASQVDNTIWSISNSSDASKKNYIEILESLKTYLPFEIFIWSWENEINSDIVMNKNQIIEEIGFWETLNDEWLNTNGIHGTANDLHWSTKTHKAFADYLIVKFPQFFNL